MHDLVELLLQEGEPAYITGAFIIRRTQVEQFETATSGEED